MNAPQRYIQQNENYAIREALRTGIPASITLAQGILESASGRSRLAREANNHFGIKCHSDWYGETIRADDDAPNECFRKYPTAEGSYIDHSKFLQKYPRYKRLFSFGVTDYVNWAKGLQEAGYATAQGYANSLINIIHENQLYKIDNKVLTRRVVRIVQWVLIILLIGILVYLGYRYKQRKKTLS